MVEAFERAPPNYVIDTWLKNVLLKHINQFQIVFKTGEG